MGIKVGIDLGTTFSAVAMMDEKKGQPVIIPNTSGEKITPSVIQFTEDGEIIVGSEAKEAFEAGESGCTSVFKRSMGIDETYCKKKKKNYTAEDLSAILLCYLKEQAEKVTGQPIDEAVVTVPAYFYHKERQATMNAAKRAGLNVRQIINEPTAAAMNYGVNHWRENARILVYDLGGGTFDVTLIQMQKNNKMRSLMTAGKHTLGGKDWDGRICMVVESKIECDTGLKVSEYPEIHRIVLQHAENIKKQLTTRNTASDRIKLPNHGRYDITVSLEEFENNTSDLIAQTGNLCEGLLKDCGMTWRDITDILLVGGSTRMRQVSAYLKRISGHNPLSKVNPDEAVALGAAIQVYLPLPKYVGLTDVLDLDNEPDNRLGLFKFKNRKTQPVKSSSYSLPGTVGKETSLANAISISPIDVVAHAMGVIAVNAEGTGYINKTIIPANQSIPVKYAEAFHYYTSARGENEVEIYVLQGTKAPLECQVIGKYIVSGISHDREDNPTIIRIQYSYDINGMIHVQARQGDSNFDLPIREEPVPDDMSKFGRPIEPQENKSIAEPLSVVMALDVSGSMAGSPIRDALDAMNNFIDNFSDYPGDVKIGLIAVSDHSKIVCSLTNNLSKCQSAVYSITCCLTGCGNCAHPFNDIKNMLYCEKGKKIGIVLADGVWCYQDRAIAAAQECHYNDIDIIGVGFGEADEKFLKAISSGDIKSMLVDQNELTQSFGKIAQEISGGKPGKYVKTGKEKKVATWRAINE